MLSDVQKTLVMFSAAIIISKNSGTRVGKFQLGRKACEFDILDDFWDFYTVFEIEYIPVNLIGKWSVI